MYAFHWTVLYTTVLSTTVLSTTICLVVSTVLIFSVYQLNATRLNTTLNLTSLGSLLNWFGIQAIRVHMKLECQTPEHHIVDWMHVIQ